MKTKARHKIKGFTLIEMLLVLVIASMIIYMVIGFMQQRTQSERIDRATLQMQQVLNAGLSYYVLKSKWPTSVACLQRSGATDCTIQFLPTQFTSPWGTNYVVTTISGKQLLYAYVQILGTAGSGTASATARAIAGKLPMAYTTSALPAPPASGAACTTASASCYVVASINIPGQNLNNATAVNYAGLYRHGGCVPVPECPVDKDGNTMTPQIMVVPVSVSGVNDPNSVIVRPIESFTAYATTHGGVLDNRPLSCKVGTNAQTSQVCNINGQPTASGKYWRVCLQVVTSDGDVSVTNTGGFSSGPGLTAYPWGGSTSLMAITRCAISNEPVGSTMSVFTQ